MGFVRASTESVTKWRKWKNNWKFSASFRNIVMNFVLVLFGLLLLHVDGLEHPITESEDDSPSTPIREAYQTGITDSVDSKASDLPGVSSTQLDELIPNPFSPPDGFDESRLLGNTDSHKRRKVTGGTVLSDGHFDELGEGLGEMHSSSSSSLLANDIQQYDEFDIGLIGDIGEDFGLNEIHDFIPTSSSSSSSSKIASDDRLPAVIKKFERFAREWYGVDGNQGIKDWSKEEISAHLSKYNRYKSVILCLAQFHNNIPLMLQTVHGAIDAIMLGPISTALPKAVRCYDRKTTPVTDPQERITARAEAKREIDEIVKVWNDGRGKTVAVKDNPKSKRYAAYKRIIDLLDRLEGDIDRLLDTVPGAVDAFGPLVDKHNARFALYERIQEYNSRITSSSSSSASTIN